MPDFTAELFRLLEDDDERIRPQRAERAAWIARFGWPEEGWMLYGGMAGLAPWDELRRSFVNGEYLATILLGQAFLEHNLAGFLDLSGDGRRVGRAGLAKILREFRDRGWITDTDFGVLDRVRRMRNPYAHYRSVEDGENLTRRAMREGEDHELLIERDARAVVRALFHLLNRHPFALGPIVYPEDDGPTIHRDQTTLPI